MERKKTIVGENKVIIEILDKIKEKIKNGEPFHFYCQLPYRPEGKHDDPVVNLILRKQWKTMEWMISEIKDEIKTYNDSQEDEKNHKNVGDYITFTNLGFHDPDKKTENSFEMKYTHSKLMIIDDNKAFLGSNNCNERSNKGNRDHEICMKFENYPEIADYRKKIMKQHIGMEIEKPNDKKSYDAIKNELNKNLDNLNLKEEKHVVRSTPWGNIPTNELEAGKKPVHVPSRTHKAISALVKVVPTLNKFSR